jgi:hypothetical protein
VDDCGGRFEDRGDGDEASEGWGDGTEEGFWNILRISAFRGFGGAVEGGAEEGAVEGAAERVVEEAAEEVEEVEAGAGEVDDGTSGGRDEMEGLPLTCPAVAGTVPKDFTSDLMGGAAEGEEDMGAETSSIDPKVTADPNEITLLVRTVQHVSHIDCGQTCLV